MSQKQSPSGVFLKRCLSHCKNYNRIRVSIFRIFPYKDRIVILSLYGEIRVRENPQSDIIQAVSFLRNTFGRLLPEFLWGTASGKMVKQQKSNGEHFQIFQKQSHSRVLLKRCLSFLKNTSGGMLLEVLKNRCLCEQCAQRSFVFIIKSKNSLLFYKNLEKQSFVA